MINPFEEKRDDREYGGNYRMWLMANGLEKKKDKKNNSRTSYHDRKWRKLVIERDSNTCQCCKSENEESFDIHHLYSHDKYKELRHDVDNGITLCNKCHSDFHKKYGYGNNTKEQFEEFINTR